MWDNHSMRKWLVLLLVIAVFYALSKLNTKSRQKRYPFLKRINSTINIVVWILLALYLVSFLRWLYGEIFM